MKKIMLAILMLSGCATLDESFHKLQGRDIDIAIQYLGIPDDKRSMDGYDVYTWQKTEGFKGGQIGCRIKLQVQGGIIRRGEYSGANGPCMGYAERLKHM
ncbi:MAG: hypothetical protein KKH74_06340 [Gammaproteobacteria bacterium]|nr:hypothetical protein [Gammaproteobacteria bacterium]MBU1732262.1 hypothetical protein [Gammaproteobacteria bacterium]MBU1893832.1 hypothetical protein [Gammaproteobacteria bacterium]